MAEIKEMKVEIIYSLRLWKMAVFLKMMKLGFIAIWFCFYKVRIGNKVFYEWFRIIDSG